MENLREFLSDWTLTIAALLGLIIAWNNAKETIARWTRKLNIFNRVKKVEEDVEELQEVILTQTNTKDKSTLI